MRKLTSSPQLWPLLALVFILFYNALVNPSFFHIFVKNGQVYGSLIDVALRAAPLILVSLGMTLVIATGGIDLSVGAVAALAASVGAFAFNQNLDFAAALSLALLTGALVGVLNSIMIVGMGTQPIIASLVAMVTGRGVAQLLLGGQIIPLSNSNYIFIGTGYLFGLPFMILLSLGTLVILNFLMRKTSASLFVEALGANSKAGSFIGLNTNLIKSSVYVIAGLMAALAGVAMSANIRAVDVNNLGLYLELDAILAVVIGGTQLTGGRFSLWGSALGALIIQTVSTTINTQGIAVEAMLMIKASVVILICLLQSRRLKNMILNFKTNAPTPLPVERIVK